MKPTHSASKWIEYAEHDFNAVRILMDAHPAAPEIVAFHCQQSAEKYLKAILVNCGAKVPFVHDLVTLKELAQEFAPGLGELTEACNRLTPFGTITRYPSEALEVTIDRLPRILGWAEVIRSAVRAAFELGSEQSLPERNDV